MHKILVCVAFAAGLAGCSDITGITEYSFDAIEYSSPTVGSTGSTMTIPMVSCTSSNDVCAAMLNLGSSSLTSSCGSANECIATADITVAQTIDLSQETSFPQDLVKIGVDVVQVERVTYWINSNAFNVAVPSLDFYVADAAAKDQTDPSATLLTTIAMVPAMSTQCGDTPYPAGDSKAAGVPVCSAPLPSAGQNALASFVKNFKTPFQLIAHTTITANPGEPIPSGSISFAARPTVGLK